MTRPNEFSFVRPVGIKVKSGRGITDIMEEPIEQECAICGVLFLTYDRRVKTCHECYLAHHVYPEEA